MNTIREIWDNSVNNFAELPAVKWLEKKDIKARSYKELNDDIIAIRKGLKAEGFDGVHISLIGTSSVSWIEAYLGITTGNNVAVPLDAGLPAEDLIALLLDSDAEALFLSPKAKALVEEIKNACPKIRKIWLLQEESEGGFATLKELKAASADTDDVKGREKNEVATLIYTSGTT